MNKKNLSVIITCHNDEKYINQCIRSITFQLCDDVEVICVDDASEDNSLQIINQYSSQIKIKQFNENVGLSCARNEAIKIANGNYLMFVDADDYIATDSLSCILHMARKGCYDIIMGLMEVFKETPDVKERWNDPIIENPAIFENKSVDEIIGELHNLKLKIAPVQKYIVKKNFIEENSLWFENVLHEDQLWTPQALCFARLIGFVNCKFYFHRIRKNSLGDRFDENVCISYLETCKKLLSIVPKISSCKKITFLRSRCKYLLLKIDSCIVEWDLDRRQSFIDSNKEDIQKLSNELELRLINFRG